MEDVVAEAGRPLFRLFYYIFRGLLWLAWDVSIEMIGWSIGWGVLRIITFGKYPQYQITEQEKAPLWQTILIEFFGIGILSLTVFVLYGLAFQ